MARDRIAERIARLQAFPIDWSRIQFNLSTREGQLAYQAFLKEHYQASDVLYELEFHERGQVIEASQRWIADKIMRLTFNLDAPGPWKRGMRVDRPDYASVEVLI